jgi:hypothetical protein
MNKTNFTNASEVKTPEVLTFELSGGQPSIAWVDVRLERIVSAVTLGTKPRL